jgi:hypothetical protein
MKHREERQEESSFRSCERLGFDIRPGPHGIRICNAIGEPSLKFGFLPIRKRCCFHVVDNAIPDCFSDLEPFLDTEAIDPEVVQ